MSRRSDLESEIDSGVTTVIKRTFKDIPRGKLKDADQQSYMASLGWSPGHSWDDLLRSKRVLIISESGAGKTYECRSQSKRLADAGEAAFFIEMASLAKEDLRGLLDTDEEARLDDWLVSQSDEATFFLDSIDELKLTQGSFERALKRLKKCIDGRLHRSRIVITTRPIPVDEELVRSILPVPQAPISESNEDAFARIAMREHRKQHEGRENPPPDWRSVALMPFSSEQIIEFCKLQGVEDAGSLYEDLERRDALEFARRPQDLIELCADWRVHTRIRSHSEQVSTNVRVKLQPNEGRYELAELSGEKAFEGACRLALASQMTRRMTIRHSANSDTIGEGAALDPASILADWQPNERKALLERSLFGFASYGRVRFHHRSVVEYLAAERLLALRKQGMPFPALKRILFAETRGKTIVRPSKRSIAGWLASREDRVFELLRDHEPEILMNEGDPESLTHNQRIQALRTYAERYGSGGWRGLDVPYIQIHRFATRELAREIGSIWRRGVANPDVRVFLFNLIEVGRIHACADIVFDIACDSSAPTIERVMAIDAMVALSDERLMGISASVADGGDRWPEAISRGAIIRVFPKYMSVSELCRCLGRIHPSRRTTSDLNRELPRLIANSSHELSSLEELRDGLLALVSEDLEWDENLSRISSPRSHLNEVLAATCERGLDMSNSDEWLRSGVIALRLQNRDHYDDGPTKSLRDRLMNLNAEDTERLFWVEDELLQSLHEVEDPWNRLANITLHVGSIQLRPDRDLPWVIEAVGDATRAISERAMLLEAAIRLLSREGTWKEKLAELRPRVADEPSLMQRLNESLRLSKHDKSFARWERQQAARKTKEERRNLKNRASWIQFWREVANQPERAFSPAKSSGTAWDLWRAMSQQGDDSRASGWNRRFIEDYFGKDTADKLRSVLMSIWRGDRPTFASERPESERNSFLVRWQLGLASIYAEAEAPDWATKLSTAEAQLAMRYVPIELNRLPEWISDVVDVHPEAVRETLGSELEWELNLGTAHSSLLQAIDHAPKGVAMLFLARLDSWLDDNSGRVRNTDDAVKMGKVVRQVTRVILKHGDAREHSRLGERALQQFEQQEPLTLKLVWLEALIRIDPQQGIELFAQQIELVEPSERSVAVTYFASLFGEPGDLILLTGELLSPPLLLRLLRLAYHHIRTQDDAHHEGSYTPDTRDNAETARNNILSSLLDAKGKEALLTKLTMSNDPLFTHFKDRILAVAEEVWAEEIDAEVFDEEQAIALDRRGEAPASTNEAMFAIMKDRLTDLDDLLLRDDSPREAWAGIKDERVMRREIARELRHLANSLYTVDQEAVTADEKETDIRLRSVGSSHEAIIELKVGDQRSAKDLRDTIENQLVRKYLTAENCKAGSLLVTLGRDRQWQHPVDKRRIKVEELLSLLESEAERVQQALGGRTHIHVHLIDLRPRLPVESKAKN